MLRLLPALGLLFAVPHPAGALHKATPASGRVTHGAPVALPSTRAWGYLLAFASTEDLLVTGSTGRQIFLFRLFDYDCLSGPPIDELATCPGSPEPLMQVTAGPGGADNPSVTIAGTLLAFEADGAYAGGVGPGVGQRQIFLLDLVTSTLTRVTDAPDGDSVRPSLDESGRRLAFASTAPLRGGPGGQSQIFLYEVSTGALTTITHGAGPSTAPMLTKLGRLVAFESTADLLGDGHDTGVAQVFWYDALAGRLHQLTQGNAPSRHPYVTNRLRNGLKKVVGSGAAIVFESAATDLPATAGGPGTQVYLATTRRFDLPPIYQLTPVQVPGCPPSPPGDSTDPAFDAFGRAITFVGTGDFFCNATSGRRAFVVDPRRLPATLFQLTSRGDVQGPVVASMGHWFAALSTTDDMSGQGVCGHQVQFVNFFAGGWQPAILPGEIPVEPTPADPALGCDDGDVCTTDACVADVCQHAPIPACP